MVRYTKKEKKAFHAGALVGARNERMAHKHVVSKKRKSKRK